MKLKIKLTAILFVLFAGTLSISSCKEDVPPEPVEQVGQFSIKLEHLWGMDLSPFVMNQPLYHPMTKDTLTFSTFKYYVSNVQLQRTDGSWWKEEESYHLVDLSKTDGNVIQLNKVPAGTYTAMNYTMGVDSMRNVSGAQTGALSVSNGMFWSWNTGYIMIKTEGTSPQSPTGDFAFHLGGFMGDQNVVTERTTGFNGETLDISAAANPQIHLNVNPARLWHGGTSVADTSKIHMPGEVAVDMATHFYGWINFDHIHR